MKLHELEKIRKDTECYLHGEIVLLHYCNHKVYVLSNDISLSGSTCLDFAEYRDRYRCSYYVFNTYSNDWDVHFLHVLLKDLQRIEENIGCLK